MMLFNLNKRRNESLIEGNSMNRKALERRVRIWTLNEISEEIARNEAAGKMLLTRDGRLAEPAKEEIQKQYKIYICEGGKSNEGIPWFTIKLG